VAGSMVAPAARSVAVKATSRLPSAPTCSPSMLPVAANAGAAADRPTASAAAPIPRRARMRPPPLTSAPELLEREDLRVDVDAVGGELVEELRAQTGGAQVPERLALLAVPGGVVEQEQVLQGDDVALHADHL